MSGSSRDVSHDTSADDLSPEAAEAVEELAARVAAGEAVDLEVLCRRYPEAAVQLRRLLPTVAAIAALGDSTVRGKLLSPPSDPEPLTGRLGEFRLIGEWRSQPMAVRLFLQISTSRKRSIR
jgi:hypothetical protein